MTYGGTLFAAYYAQHASRLPAGYREVEYLESDREAMLDTGVVFTGDLEIKCMAFFKYMAGSVVRARYNADGNSYQLFILTGNNRNEVQGAYNLTGINNLLVTGIQYNTWFDATLTNRSLTVNGVTNSTGSQTIPPNSAHIYVNAVIYANGSMSASQSVFSKIEIKRGTSLVRSLVPCVRTADNKPGMYDLCGSICPLTNTPFYVNAGSGADFLWGELS